MRENIERAKPPLGDQALAYEAQPVQGLDGQLKARREARKNGK